MVDENFHLFYEKFLSLKSYYKNKPKNFKI